MSHVTVHGHLTVNEKTVLTILEEEGQKAERLTLRFTRDAIRDAAPVGTGHHKWGDIHLAASFRYRVKRSPYGLIGFITRDPAAWYGRVVELGREEGVSRNGRHYPGARANPFIERTMGEIEDRAHVMLEEGGLRAGERIGAMVTAI